MADLSIITLTVNGLREQRKRLFLFYFLNRLKFDIVLLQETHVSSLNDCVLWNCESRFKGYWSLGTSSSCGVGILVREGLQLEHCSYRYDHAGRVALLDFTYNKQDFRIVNLYVPTDGSQRIEFLQSLDCYLVTRRRLVVGGDFNCLLDLSKDKCGGNPSLGDTGAQYLKQLLSRYSLVDIWRKQHESSREFTWRNKAGTIRCRLDRFYISSSLVNDCVIESDILPYVYFDHDLVHLQLQVGNSCNNIGPGLWKLNTSLLSHKSVRDKVIRFWSDWRTKKSHFSNVSEWWDAGKSRIKSLLITCGRNLSKSSNQERACLLNRYRALMGQSVLSDSDMKELDDVKAQLVNLDYRQVRGHAVRSKAKWIETNEQASKFFFQKATKRAVKKTCSALKTKDGQRVTTQSDIMHEQVRFYQELYTRVPTDRAAQDRLLNLLDGKLSKEQSNSCEGDIFEGECLAALKSLRNGQTPGSDGLPKEFYLSFWDVVKDDFVEMLNH